MAENIEENIEVKETPGNEVVEAQETTDTAPIEGKPETPTEDDIAPMIATLEALDESDGSDDEMIEIPKRLVRVMKAVLESSVSVLNAVEDPYYKDVLRDMSEQEEEGMQPDFILAINRVIPKEELDGIEGNENYEALQGSLNDRVAMAKAEEDADMDLLNKIDESKANLDAYAEQNGLDEARKTQLWETVRKTIAAFSDGLLSIDEFALFDKGGNYDADIEVMKAKIPQQTKKEVIPDSSSAIPRNTPVKKAAAPATTFVPEYKKMNQNKNNIKLNN